MEEETATATTTYPMLVGQDVLVRITTVDGTFNEAGFTYEGEGDGGVTPPPTVTSARTPEMISLILTNGVGAISGFTSPTADGNLLVLTTGHRTGDPDTYNTPTISGWTLQGVGYNTPSSTSDRRIVAIFTKISVNGENLDTTINWNNDPGADHESWVTLQEFTGATSYTPAGDGGNFGSGTSLAVPSSPLPAPGEDNILAIAGMVWRGAPSGVGFTNGFGDLVTNTIDTDCHGVTAYTYTTAGDVAWDTTATWSGSLLNAGVLVLFSCN